MDSTNKQKTEPDKREKLMIFHDISFYGEKLKQFEKERESSWKKA